MIETRIPGVRYGTVQRHADERGAFRELWRESTVGRIEPGYAGAAAERVRGRPPGGVAPRHQDARPLDGEGAPGGP